MKKFKMMSLWAIVAFFIFGAVVSVSLAKNDNASKGNNSSSSKSEKIKELKNYEKPTKEKTNAAIHKEKIDEVTAELEEIAEDEKNKGQQNREEKTVEKKVNNPDIGEQEQVKKKTREEIAEELEEVAEDVSETESGTVEAINEVEKENAFKKFFVGTDYKNLGQLRSSLAHNENQIRKLTALSGDVVDEEMGLVVGNQLMTLMQERERIKTVISDNEEGFSLLGWAFRFMNGYSSEDSIDEEAEIELEEEVVAILEDETEEAETEIQEPIMTEN